VSNSERPLILYHHTSVLMLLRVVT